jgi:glycosyltransferase involved in cell wall biosynthesis
MVSVIEEFKNKHTVIVASFGIENSFEDLICYDFTCGVKQRYVRAFLTRNITFMPFLQIFLLVLKYKPIIIYCREIRLLFNLLLVKSIFKIKIIVDIRENPKILQKTQEYLLKKFPKKIDFLRTNAPFLKDKLIKEYGFKNVQLLFDIPSNQFLDQVKINPNVNEPLRLCFFGDVKPDRKIEIAIEGINISNHNITIDIFGRINDNSYKEYLLSLDLMKKIRFHGLINYETSPKVLVDYDLGILLNEINENSKITIPGKLWEYAACGLGIISNRRITVKKLIEDYDIGVFADNPTEFDQQIGVLMKNRNLVYKIKANSQKFFNTFYQKQKQELKNINLI